MELQLISWEVGWKANTQSPFHPRVINRQGEEEALCFTSS